MYGGSYALITEVLRNEWGFNGLVLTDYWESPYMEAMQMLAAGGDATLISAKNPESKIADTESNMALSKMRDAAKHICYTVVNSSAMNGITYNTSKFNGIPVYVLILVALDLVTAIVIGLHIRAVRKYMRNAKEQKMVLL